MSHFASLLDEALESWEDTRLGVIAEVQQFRGKAFDYRPTPGVRSVREQVVHILEVAMLMVGELRRPDTDLQREPFPKLLKRYAKPAYAARGSRSGLLKLCKTQMRDGIKAFREAGEIHMLQTITRFDGRPGTRLAWFQHGIAQEWYHRGQLATYARLLGQEPALTKRIREAHGG